MAKKKHRRQQRQFRSTRVAKIATAAPRKPGAPEVSVLAAELLQDVAVALNALENFCRSVKLRHDAVVTEYGYVLPFGETPAVWEIRTRLLDGFPVSPADDET